MRYVTLGDVPRKRHVQVRRNGASSPLLTEEVLGYEGFSGNESILLHLQSPCRLDAVGDFRPIEREEWVPDAHVHRLADANPVETGGDPVSARQLLMWNGDIEVSVCKPTEELERFYRNGEGDEVIYVHRGRGVLRTVFGRVEFRERDVANDFGALRAMYGLTRQSFVPVVEAGGRALVRPSDAELRELLP